MMMVDDGGGRGVKNGRKSDDVINGRPLRGAQWIGSICPSHIFVLFLPKIVYFYTYWAQNEGGLDPPDTVGNAHHPWTSMYLSMYLVILALQRFIQQIFMYKIDHFSQNQNNMRKVLQYYTSILCTSKIFTIYFRHNFLDTKQIICFSYLKI